MKEEIEKDEVVEAYELGIKDCKEAYHGISPSTVTEMIEALREVVVYYSNNQTVSITGQTLDGKYPLKKAKEVLSKADKELKK